MLDFFFAAWYNAVMESETTQKYERTALAQTFEVSAVYTVHYFKYMQNYSFVGESHPFWEFVYIDSGRAQIRAGERELFLGQGEAYFHRPNEYHNIRTDNRFARSVIFSFECFSPAMRTFEGCKTVLTDDEKEILNHIIKESRALFTDNLGEVRLYKLNKSPFAPPGSEQLIKTDIERLLISVYRRLVSPAENARPKSKNAGELTDRIKEILEENLYGRISLDEIAGALFFSKTYIKQVFKKNTGSTIMDYFTALKIEEAKRLISTDRYTFTEIAYRLGYTSLHYFSRQFKSKTTMSLTEYARSIKVENVL